MEDLELEVLRVVERESGVEHLSLMTPLEDLGLDSLDMAQLLVTIRREVGDVPDLRWSSLRVVGDIAKAVTR